MPTFQPVAVGIVTLRPSIWATGSIAVLNELYTKPEARGHGFGWAILDAAIAEARRRGVTDVDFGVTASDINTHRF